MLLASSLQLMILNPQCCTRTLWSDDVYNSEVAVAVLVDSPSACRSLLVKGTGKFRHTNTSMYTLTTASKRLPSAPPC